MTFGRVKSAICHYVVTGTKGDFTGKWPYGVAVLTPHGGYMTVVPSGNQTPSALALIFYKTDVNLKKEPPLPVPSYPPNQSRCWVITLTYLDYDLRAKKSKFFQRDFELKTKKSYNDAHRAFSFSLVESISPKIA